MRFSYNWMHELVDGLDVSAEELGRLITLKTAECEGVEPHGAMLDDVCVARVLTAEKVAGTHLTLTTVDTGRYGVKQVICFVAQGVIGLSRADGRLLWRIPVKTAFARHVTTPVVFGDYVVVASHEVGLIGIKVSKDGEGVKAEQTWVNKAGAMNFSSPVVVGSSLFGLGPTKNLICVDIPTGSLLWSQDGYINTW